MGVGVDIVEISRVKGIRFLERFAEYFLSAPELKAFHAHKDPIAFIASRFAAKEAIIKAFPGFLSPHDFEIIKYGKKPTVRFVSQKTASRYSTSVSIAHSTDYAVGYAIIQKK